MKILFTKTVDALYSRTARNIYFWSFWLGIKLINVKSGTQFVFILILWSLLVLLFNANNFWLVPKLFVKKNRWKYFFSITGVTFFIAIAYTFTLKFMRHYYPGLHVGDVSHIVNALTPDLTMVSLLQETLVYFGFFIFFIFLFTSFWYMNDYRRQQMIVEKTKQQQTETELHFLKSQISPHFLFNTLNNIYGLAGKRSSLTQTVVLQLSEILRYLLYESNSALISFEKEKKVIQAYIQMEAMQLPEMKNCRFYIEADAAYMIPPLLWLPVLENIFKHGAHIATDGLFIDFHFSIEQGQLKILAENSYMPYKQQQENKPPGGIGIDNLRKRLLSLYPGRHHIQTTVANEHFITHIQIALS